MVAGGWWWAVVSTKIFLLYIIPFPLLFLTPSLSAQAEGDHGDKNGDQVEHIVETAEVLYKLAINVCVCVKRSNMFLNIRVYIRRFS